METLDTRFHAKIYSNPDESIQVIKSSRLIHSNICKTSLKTHELVRIIDLEFLTGISGSVKTGLIIDESLSQPPRSMKIGLKQTNQYKSIKIMS